MPPSVPLTKRPAIIFIAGTIVGVGLAGLVAFLHFQQGRGDQETIAVDPVMLEPYISVDRVNFPEDRKDHIYRLMIECRSYDANTFPALAKPGADPNLPLRREAGRHFGMDGIREAAWRAGRPVYRRGRHWSTTCPPFAYFMLDIDPSWLRWRRHEKPNDRRAVYPAVICISYPNAGHSVTQLTDRYGDYICRSIPPYLEQSWDNGMVELWAVHSHDANDNTWYVTRVWIEAKKKNDH